MVHVMATKTYSIVEDDIDGSGDAQTITFALEGKSYEIDLGEKNADKLRKALAPFIEAGRRSGAKRQSAPAGAKSDTKAIREWATANGVAVPERGRIPAAVREQYNAAN
jgi:hypothetical protein